MQGVKYDPETKGEAFALLSLGCTVSEVARELNLTWMTVARWKRELPEPDLLKNVEARRERVLDASDDYLFRTFHSLGEQADQLGDREYLKRFPPSQIADAHDKMASRAGGILAIRIGSRQSMEGTDQDDETDTEEETTKQEEKPRIQIERYEDTTSVSSSESAED